uniref:Uncharacterized protein n=1 Tax=Arundo donax TaxID=35708 RepID=A0A0A9CC24_ARUDO
MMIINIIYVFQIQHPKEPHLF